MAVKIIAEVAQAHDGSIGRAHSFIDAVSDCGVDAIKFQTHIAQYESSDLEPWRVKFGYEDETRYDYWKRMEFPEEQWAGLIQHSRERGLEFIGTPFSVESLEMLCRLGVQRWKLASGEITNRFLVRQLAKLGQPVIMSSGMSNWEELDETVRCLQDGGVELTLLQCTSAYPVPLEKVGLNVLKQMMERYQIPVGLSDHSGDIFASLAAVALGAQCIEVHFCLSPYDFGPDTVASLTVEQLKMLVQGIRQIEIMLEHPINKDAQAQELATMHTIFTKSLYAKEPIPAGTEIRWEMLGAKKPCAGIPVTDVEKVLGRHASRTVDADSFLHWEDVER